MIGLSRPITDDRPGIEASYSTGQNLNYMHTAI